MNVSDAPRQCPECEGQMALEHGGRFTTLYICRGCGTMLTIPAAEPAVTNAVREEPPPRAEPRQRGKHEHRPGRRK
jgi:hypothetical protein